MRVLLSFTVPLWLAACASSGSGDRSYRFGASDNDIRITCPLDWGECYHKAREYCGPAGYREVRRAGQGGPTTAGGSDPRTEELYRRAGRSTPSEREMTIRCKADRSQ